MSTLTDLVIPMLPRGIRNNNPLNIRIGNAWLGEVAKPTDKEFEQFVAPVYGLRAAFIILRRYISRYNLRTVDQIISRWAPAKENNTENYIKQVCEISHIHRGEELDFTDAERMIALVDAMIQIENGVSLPISLVESAYSMVKHAASNFQI